MWSAHQSEAHWKVEGWYSTVGSWDFNTCPEKFGKFEFLITTELKIN